MLHIRVLCSEHPHSEWFVKLCFSRNKHPSFTMFQLILTPHAKKKQNISRLAEVKSGNQPWLVALLYISESLHPYLSSHFAPSAPCTPGFLHPCCEMIGVISPGPVSHGWLITLSEPSYKNSLQASLPRWDTASNDCEDVLWFTCFFSVFLFFIVRHTGRILKQQRLKCVTHCDSISCKTQQHVPLCRHTKWKNIFKISPFWCDDIVWY